MAELSSRGHVGPVENVFNVEQEVELTCSKKAARRWCLVPEGRMIITSQHDLRRGLDGLAILGDSCREHIPQEGSASLTNLADHFYTAKHDSFDR